MRSVEKTKESIQAIVLPLFLVAIVLIIWDVAARIVNFVFLPTPIDVLYAFPILYNSGELASAVATTGQAMLVGYLISVGIGVTFGLLMGVSRPFGKAAEPLITAFYSFPHGVLIPIMVLVFGIGLLTRIVIVILYTFFAIVLNTYSGVINTSNEYRDLGRAFNLKRTEIWKRIILPGASASILTGLRVAFGYAIRGSVMAELLIGAVGLGGLVLFYTGFWRLDLVFAVILILMAIGLTSNYALRYIERKLCPWKREYGEGQ